MFEMLTPQKSYWKIVWGINNTKLSCDKWDLQIASFLVREFIIDQFSIATYQLDFKLNLLKKI